MGTGSCSTLSSGTCANRAQATHGKADIERRSCKRGQDVLLGSTPVQRAVANRTVSRGEDELHAGLQHPWPNPGGRLQLGQPSRAAGSLYFHVGGWSGRTVGEVALEMIPAGR